MALTNFKANGIAKTGGTRRQKSVGVVVKSVSVQHGLIGQNEGSDFAVRGSRRRPVTRRDKLAQSERYYRRLFEQAHDAILIFRPEGETVLDVNDRACELYGFTREEFLGMSLERISRNVPEGRRQIGRMLELGMSLNFESVQSRKDGSAMNVEINAAVVEYQGELAILSINRDITWRKEAEAELVKAARREVLATLAGGIAHEFNSLLLAAHVYLQNPGSSERHETIQKSAALIQQAQSLSASLLEVFTGPEGTPATVLDVGSWLPECVERLSGMLPLGATLSRCESGAGLAAHADPLALEQVLRILITNAADAMNNSGEVRVTACGAGADAQGAGWVEVRVSDTGSGVAPENRERVFEPFFTTRKRTRRSGLGLSIASRLVEQVGGTLRYEPNEPVGSVFVIRLRGAQGAER